jgi:hypothetical protein
MISILLPFWLIFAIFSPALLLFMFVGIQSGAKPATKAKAPVGELHLSVAPADKNTAPDSARQS